MISAGIFALLGQIAELSHKWFPLIFIIGAIVTAFSAHSYIKYSQHYPSAGGIGMYLVKAYGKGVFASIGALMMIFSMIINQSLVARTFGSYTMQLFGGPNNTWIIPVLGVGLLIFSLTVNLLGNLVIQSFTSVMSLVKILGLIIFSFGGLYATKFAFSLAETTQTPTDVSFIHYIAGVALAILAFKGFTTITNNGAEIKQPKVNVGRAIMISIAVSLIIYLIIAFAVSGNLTVSEIIQTKDYALAEASRPAFGQLGLWFTVVIAIIATVTGIIASVFAVSRLIAMLADMDLIPHKNVLSSMSTQQHMVIYTVGFAIILTILFDLSRIASLGAILYLVMDMMIHYGLVGKLSNEIDANKWIVWTALILDAIVLSAFLYIKITSDILVVGVSIVIILLLFIMQKLYLHNTKQANNSDT
jgi:amino acid transporter